jgi:hypothetical protein
MAFGTATRPINLEGAHHMLRSLQQSKNAPSIAVQSPSISHLLGIVYAPDEKSAEAAAIAEFKIGEEQRLALARG